jgi:hypothetical protein
MTPIHWMQVITLVAGTVNVCGVLYQWALMRRWRLLVMLMDRIVLEAFVNRHVPIWVPWSAARGMDFEISLHPAKDRSRSE